MVRNHLKCRYNGNGVQRYILFRGSWKAKGGFFPLGTTCKYKVNNVDGIFLTLV